MIGAWKRGIAAAAAMLLIMGMMKPVHNEGEAVVQSSALQPFVSSAAQAYGSQGSQLLYSPQQASLKPQQRKQSGITSEPQPQAPSDSQPQPKPQPKPPASKSEADPSGSKPSSGDNAPSSAQQAKTDKPSAVDKVVYLTFDDGPSKWTPKVLDILAANQVHATFFVLGESAEHNPAALARIVKEGHGLGNHTYNHKYEELYRSFNGFWTQVKKTDEILTRMTGQQVSLLRAPGGTYMNFDAYYFQYLRQAGYRIMDWNVDSGDSKRTNVPADEIIQTVKQSKLANEVTLLMHDGSGHEQSVKALPAIIRYFKDKGYRFAVMDEQTKPVTFRVGPDKWKRVWTGALHQQAQAEVKSFQAAKPWVLLRDWLDGKGTVIWDQEKREATVAIGNDSFRLVPQGGQMVRVIGDSSIEGTKFSFKMTDNKFYVLKTA